MITTISNNDTTALTAAPVALLDVSAEWCGPCKMLAPVLEELSEEMPNVTFFNADADVNPQLAAQLGVSSIPALFVLKQGEIVANTVGFLPKEQVKSWIESAL